MYTTEKEQKYYEKEPMKMTEEEAKISVAYWKAKYEGVCQNLVNLQSDLDRFNDWIYEQNMIREHPNLQPK